MVVTEYYAGPGGPELWHNPVRGGWKYYNPVTMVEPDNDTIYTDAQAEEIRREHFPDAPPIIEGAA